MEEEKEMGKLSKCDTIGLIRCILYSNVEGLYVLSEFLYDFEEEAGYPLPSFEEETPLDFLKSIPWIVQVVEVEGNLYLKHVEWEDSDDWDTFLAPDVDCGEIVNERELNKEKEAERKRLEAREKMREIKRGKEKERFHSQSTSPARSKSPEDDAQSVGIVKRKRKRKRKVRWNGAEPVYYWDSEEEKESRIPEEEYGDEPICHRCEPLEAELTFDNCIDRCLNTIVTDLKDLPLISLTERMDVGDVIEVSVADVVHPHKFFVHLKKFRIELTKLMGRMQTFYSLYNAKYSVENFKFEKGMVCAALYRTNPECREWYRAKIISMDTDTTKVSLIDYGLITDVSNRNLKYLDRLFEDLPIQAINARLGNVIPITEKHWTEDSCKRLYDITFEKDLVAEVLYINPEKRWLSVTLAVPGSDFSVDRALVKDKSPNPDCDFHQEPRPRMYYETVDQERFILPEDIGKTRRLRTEFRDDPELKKKRKVPYQERNRELRRMLGLKVSDEEEWSSNEA